MSKLLNICNKDGKAITFFDGKITLSQLIAVIVAVAVIFFAIKVLNKIVKTVVIIVALCACLVYYGVASPTQIKDAAGVIAKNGISTYNKIASASDNIKVEDKTIKLNINDTWIDISDVTSFIETSEGIATVIIDGISYSVDDESIVSLLKTFK